jgi:sugar/nucleoside kinase (ribokinase family)
VTGQLLHVGTVVVDAVLAVPALPARGGDVLAGGATLTPGGAFNVMAAAARQGMAVAYGGAHGTGPLAALARAALGREGIVVLLPPLPGADTGFVVTMVEPGGERTFVTSPGAEAQLTAAALASLTITGQDAICLSGYALLHPSNRDALLAWLPSLSQDALLVVDPGPLGGQVPPDALAAVARRATWWACNAAEATAATGEHDPATAARALAAQTGQASGPVRPGGVLVRTGPDGCLLAGPAAGPGGGPVPVPGFGVRAVDTTGAGDTHTGAFIAALDRGATPLDAARRANAAAAFSVVRPGPATAPTTAELDAFLATAP